MQLLNETKGVAGWTMGFSRDGREVMIVVVKVTFLIPKHGDQSQLADEQVPLIDADSFTGEPGQSAPIYESDYAHHKPLCDVLVEGTAYSPVGDKTTRIQCGVRVGSVAKVFSVVGNREWRSGLLGVAPTEPEPFEVMPISYDRAFGGVDVEAEGNRVVTFEENPVGKGFGRSKERVVGSPLPNTEELDRPVGDPTGSYRPMALGVIGRNWQPRSRWAGTYDAAWLDQRAPFWPTDFDYRYFQAAPADQQLTKASGGEDVVLKNLTPDGLVAFTLPQLSMPVWFLPYKGNDRRIDGVLDTIMIEPDLGRFTLTWRAALPMRRSCFDIRQVIAGEMSAAWERTRKYGERPYYKGLAELARARRKP